MSRKKNDDDLSMALVKVACHTAIDQTLARLRDTCNELADKMERGEFPMQSGPNALRLVAITVDADRHKRELRGIEL